MGAAQSKRKNHSKGSIMVDHANTNLKCRQLSVEPPSPTRQKSQSSTSRPAYSSLSERAASYSPARPQLLFLPENNASNNGSNNNNNNNNNSLSGDNIPAVSISLQQRQQASLLGAPQRRRTLTGPIRRSDDYALQTDSVFLPHDWDVEDRFFSLHHTIKKIFRGNVAAGVQPKLKAGARVAEIGCGNGPWITDMAAQFPDCQYFGVDTPHELSPSPQLLTKKNVQFHAVEINKGALPFPANSFDVIYGRALGFRFGVGNWAQLLREMRRVLKPGGVIQVLEPHFKPEGTVLIDSFAETLKKICIVVDKDFDLAEKIPQILDNEGLQTLDHKRVTIDFGQKDRISDQSMAVLLRAFELIKPHFGPAMGLDEDEYEQRVEMFCAQCVQHHSTLDWHSYVCTPTSFMLSVTNNS